MKKSLFRKVLCFVLSVTVLLSCMGFSVSAASLKDEEGVAHPYDVPSLEEMQSLVGTMSTLRTMAIILPVPRIS